MMNTQAREHQTADKVSRQIANTPADDHIRAVNGDFLPIRTWLPQAKPRRVVVALHGMVTHSGWFSQLGNLLVECGVALIAPDRRGNGQAKHLGQISDTDLLMADVDVAVQHARQLSDDVTLFSWCGSANFAVPAAAQVAADRFVMASPGLVPLAEMSARFRCTQAIDGFLPIHFDPAGDFTDDAETKDIICADKLYLRRIPEELRGAWKKLNPIAREALHNLPIPAHCVLTRVDRMIDIPKTLDLMGDIPIHWASGGHGFVVEPAGANSVAELLGKP